MKRKEREMKNEREREREKRERVRVRNIIMCSDSGLGKVPLVVAIVAQLPGYMRLEASPEGQPAPLRASPSSWHNG